MSRKIGFGEGNASDTQPNRRAHKGTASAQQFWEKRLYPGENLLWEGRPNFHIQLDQTALRLSLPGVAGAAFLGYMYFTSPFKIVISEEFVPGISNDILVPLFIAGLLAYLLFYNLRHSLVHPGLTRYALTNKRAMVANKLPFPRVKTYRLTPMTPVHWLGDEPGTITFAEDLTHYDHKVIRSKHVGFHNISDAEHVLNLMNRAKEGKL